MASTKPNQADGIWACSRPDAICILPVGTKNAHQRDIQAIHPSRWDVHLIEVKYYDETRPEQQLARATEIAYWIETRPCTAMPRSKPTYHPDWNGEDHL